MLGVAEQEMLCRADVRVVPAQETLASAPRALIGAAGGGPDVSRARSLLGVAEQEKRCRADEWRIESW
jgi:hypothetical protein